MQFEKFLSNIEAIKSITLPATISHQKMVPKNRVFQLTESEYKSRNTKKAGVLMLLYPKNNVAYIALILRNEYNGVHSSQIAFPGGKYEEADSSLEQTALRETFEEIGINSNKIEVIKAFSTVFIEPSNFLVYPFLGVSYQELTFSPDKTEVQQVIEIPLSMLLDNNSLKTKTITTSYAINIIIPAFEFFNHTVWGATAMMLSELKDVLKQFD